MINTVGETVKFNQDLNINFDANLIDLLEVYNPSQKKITKCEHWGWNEKNENGLPFYDFGLIADFDFVITKKKTTFYFGDAPIYGFNINDKSRLVFLPRGKIMVDDSFQQVGTFNYSKEYDAPKTMLDLANNIDDFLYERKRERIRLTSIHSDFLKMKSRPNPKNRKPSFDDLPF